MKSKSKGEDQCEGGKEGGSELGGRRLGDKGRLHIFGSVDLKKRLGTTFTSEVTVKLFRGLVRTFRKHTKLRGARVEDDLHSLAWGADTDVDKVLTALEVFDGNARLGDGGDVAGRRVGLGLDVAGETVGHFGGLVRELVLWVPLPNAQHNRPTVLKRLEVEHDNVLAEQNIADEDERHPPRHTLHTALVGNGPSLIAHVPNRERNREDTTGDVDVKLALVFRMGLVLHQRQPFLVGVHLEQPRSGVGQDEAGSPAIEHAMERFGLFGELKELDVAKLDAQHGDHVLSGLDAGGDEHIPIHSARVVSAKLQFRRSLCGEK
mmetsp:Transcript_65933/g.143936  ORF Transcript_65933/g.143936 Transcript_65933/m.143936 type:complete len:320 (-) Transcript_65933:456-1415(-)